MGCMSQSFNRIQNLWLASMLTIILSWVESKGDLLVQEKTSM
jgi:hypothetical protein